MPCSLPWPWPLLFLKIGFQQASVKAHTIDVPIAELPILSQMHPSDSKGAWAGFPVSIFGATVAIIIAS
jgi:hypothetical protein